MTQLVDDIINVQVQDIIQPIIAAPPPSPPDNYDFQDGVNYTFQDGVNYEFN